MLVFPRKAGGIGPGFWVLEVSGFRVGELGSRMLLGSLGSPPRELKFDLLAVLPCSDTDLVSSWAAQGQPQGSKLGLGLEIFRKQ